MGRNAFAIASDDDDDAAPVAVMFDHRADNVYSIIRVLKFISHLTMSKTNRKRSSVSLSLFHSLSLQIHIGRLME